MAIPEVNNDQPIFQPEEVVSRAASHEAMAEVFGDVSQFANNAVNTINKDISTSMLTTGMAKLSDARDAALTSMTSNPTPGNVQAALSNYKSASQGILGSIPLNVDDKSMLDKSNISYGEGIQKTGMLIDAKNTLRINQANFISSAEKMMAGITTDLGSNPQQAKANIDVFNQQLKDGYAAGLISQDTYRNYADSISTLLQRRAAISDLAKSPGVSAKTYQTVNAFMPPTPASVANPPINGDTNFRFEALSKDANFKDAVANIYQNKTLSWTPASSVTKDQFNQYIGLAHGAAIALGDINSAQSYSQISAKSDELNKMSGDTMTLQQQGERDQLNYFRDHLKTNFLDAIAETPKGMEIQNTYTQSLYAIQHSNQSDSEKQAAMSKAYTDSIGAVVKYANSMHIPPALIKPAPAQIVNLAQGSFNLDSDSKAALTAINSQGQYATYLASSMATPLQQETINSVYRLNGTQNAGPMQDVLIKANQTGRDFSNVMIKKHDLAAALVTDSNIKGLLSYVGQQDNGAGRTPQIERMLTNTVKYMAQQNGDFSGANLDAYVSKVGQSLDNAYGLINGSNYTFSQGETKFSQGDCEAVAAYITNIANQKIKSKMDGASWLAYSDANPISVTNTPDGYVVANDSNAVTYYRQPITTALVSAAHAWYSKNPGTNRLFDDRQLLTSQEQDLANQFESVDSNGPSK